jgi:hypothetical protein
MLGASGCLGDTDRGVRIGQDPARLRKVFVPGSGKSQAAFPAMHKRYPEFIFQVTNLPAE